MQITVDQLRGDLPGRYLEHMGDSGFRYLMQHGVWYANAHHAHANTETAVPSLGYKQCAELAREGHETGKSLHDIVVNERKLLSQQKWDEIFSFENLINPKFEQ